MKELFQLTIDASRTDLMSVVKYDLADFDLTLFWGKGKIEKKLPESVKLLVNKQAGREPDLLGNPISWHIASERLINFWKPEIETAVQRFEAPLFDIQESDKISGYEILNPLKFVEALNKEKSVFLGEIITEFVFDRQKVPSDCHIFRPVEFPEAIIVSDILVNRLVGMGLEGIAFIRCGMF